MAEIQTVPESLRAEIMKLAKDGDKDKEGALTQAVLLRIMRVAKTGRDLLASLDASPENLGALVKGGGAPGQFAVNTGSFDYGDSSSNTAVSPVAFGSSSLPNENFGMTAIREIIAAAKDFRRQDSGDSPVKIVEAIALAKDKGLDSVVKELEAKLGINGKLEPVPAPEPEKKKEETAA